MNQQVSVIMSVYNAAPYVNDAIESILNQTYPYIEFLITNDASTDESLGIIERYAAQDDRIRVFKNEVNRGLTQSLNSMIKQARGVYIARMDADDIALPTRFEEQIKVFNEHDEVGLVFTDTTLIGPDNRVICPSWRPATLKGILRYISFWSYIPHPTVVVKKELFERYGLYNPDARYYRREDLELWNRLLAHGTRFFYVKQTLLQYRIHGGNISKDRGRSNYYNLAAACIANNYKRGIIKYFKYLKFKEKVAMIIKMIIPFKLLRFKGYLVERSIVRKLLR